jgi:rare lipoprotein A
VTRRIKKFFRSRGFVLVTAGAALLLYYSRHLPIRFSFPLYGQSSWYSRESPGINERTANNEKFDDQAMTGALWGVRFNQKVKVTNLDNGTSVIIRVNDRGPARRFVRQGRVIDLTEGAFSRVAPLKRGIIDVRVDLVKE